MKKKNNSIIHSRSNLCQYWQFTFFYFDNSMSWRANCCQKSPVDRLIFNAFRDSLILRRSICRYRGRPSNLRTMRLDYNGIVNRWRSVHMRWWVNHRFHVGHLWCLHVHHFRRRVLNGRCVDQWFLVERDLGEGCFVLLKEDLRHLVMIHVVLVHGRVVQRLLVDRRVRKHGTLVDGLDVLQWLMLHRVIIYLRCRRLHVRNGWLRQYWIGVRLLDVL